MHPPIRFRISTVRVVHIDWTHLLAFVLTVIGTLVTVLQAQIQAGTTLTWGAFATALIGAVWLAIQRSIVQLNPPPPTAFDRHDTPPEVPRPNLRNERSSLTGLVVMLTFMGSGMVGILAMGTVEEACVPNPGGQFQDGLALEQCVVKHWGEPFLTVVSACAQNEEQAVADAIADVLAILAMHADGGVVGNPYDNEPKVHQSIVRRHPQLGRLQLLRGGAS